MTTRWWMWLGLSLVLGLAGCEEDKGWASPCESSEDCPDEMTCPASGVFAGRCAIPCGSGATCREQLGEEAFCHIDYECTLRCDRDNDCPGGFFCNTNASPNNCRVER